jgi:DNA-binding transcriptional MocR family regulator
VRGPREVISRLAAARSSQDVAPPVLEQLLALELMGELDAIRDGRRGLLGQRRASAVAEVRGAGWEVVPPSGGLFLWADLNGASSTRLSLAARARGVRIPPGTRYSASGTHDRYFRVPVTCPPASLAEAIRRITEAAPAGRVRSGQIPVWTV